MERNEHFQPLIDHAPTPGELEAAAEANGEATDRVIPREEVDTMLQAMGYTVPDRSGKPYQSRVPAGQPSVTPDTEPSEEPDFEQPISGERLAALREHIRNQASSSQPGQH